MKKLFRFHEATLTESLATTIEVSGLPDLSAKITNALNGEINNIRIKRHPWRDVKQPEEWGDTYFYVVGDKDGYKDYLVGECNFYEAQ